MFILHSKNSTLAIAMKKHGRENIKPFLPFSNLLNLSLFFQIFWQLLAERAKLWS